MGKKLINLRQLLEECKKVLEFYATCKREEYEDGLNCEPFVDNGKIANSLLTRINEVLK